MYLNKEALKKAAGWFDCVVSQAGAAQRKAKELLEADDVDGYMYDKTLTKVTRELAEIAKDVRIAESSAEFGLCDLFSVLIKERPEKEQEPAKEITAIADADLDQVPVEALE